MREEFTKDMFETGMVVELNNGWIAIVVGDGLIFLNAEVERGNLGWGSIIGSNANCDKEFHLKRVFEKISTCDIRNCFNEKCIPESVTLKEIWNSYDNKKLQVEIEEIKLEQIELAKKQEDLADRIFKLSIDKNL